MSESEDEYAEGEEEDLSATHNSIHSEASLNNHGRNHGKQTGATTAQLRLMQGLSSSENAINQLSQKDSQSLSKSKSDQLVPPQHYPQKNISDRNQRAAGDDSADHDDLLTGEDDDDDDDDDEISGTAYGIKGSAGFKDSSLSDEMKEIFQYISRYRPQEIEMEPELKPFIPEFIPAIGDIDAFIKISRPDQKPESLGLTVLDEPGGKQSDPTVLDLHLRAVTKSIAPVPQVIRSIDCISLRSNSKPLDNWIRNVKELHAAKPAPAVHYSRRMPDIEDLMQVWPSEIEEALATVTLPSADLEISLASYARLLAAILDIPTPPPQQQQQQPKDGKRKPVTSTIESLHVLFTLYSEFKNSQHFRSFERTNVDRDASGAQ
ncbi:Intraflagellar transport protein 46 [Physocladia obscura]|uniref:Intraflagellar transport protein 46 n=1 Tax=Physocladia obscura TaxID=109957 RepID=A0AAD5STM1_9FUNG|nr:Intraflagellar transport protein 46 [Physocladia obscura]